MAKPHLLIYLPKGFYTAQPLKPVFRRLSKLATLRMRDPGGSNLYTTARGKELSDDDPLWADLPWADAVIMWSWPRTLTPAMLDRMPRLRWSGNIDIGQMAAKVLLDARQAVSLAKKGWGPAVAEAALAMMLSALRKITEYNTAMRAGREFWALTDYPDSLDATERSLSGKAVGVIGFGGIGRRLVELLRPFGCCVRVCDPYVPAEAIEQAGCRKSSLMALLRSSDVSVVCAASNAGTRKLIGPRELAAMPTNSLLVNVARASLVDTDALVARLKRGDMFAAVDVFDSEPLAPRHPLRKLPNAYLTPHRAGGIYDSLLLILTWLADDFEAHLAGQPLRHAISPAVLPSLDG